MGRNARGLAVLAVGLASLGLLAGLLALGRSPGIEISRAPSAAPPEEARETPAPVTDPEVLRERETTGLDRARRAVMQEIGAADLGAHARPALRRLPDGSLEAMETPLRQNFSEGGVTLSYPKDAPLSLRLMDVRMGGVPVVPPGLLGGVPPQTSWRRSESVLYERGAVREEYQPSANAVEQVFVLDKSLEPLRASGDLAIAVALDTSLQAVPRGPEGAPEAIEFRRADGDVRYTYGGATAIDAAGRTHGLDYALRDGALEMRLDAGFLAKAEFPLTIDPLVGGNFAIDSSGGADAYPDVAYNPFIDAYLVVYERNTSSTNGDIYCAVVTGAGAVTSSGATVNNSSTYNSRVPKVASATGTNQFLVVWSNRDSAGGATRNEILCQFMTVTGNIPSVSGVVRQVPDHSVRATDDGRLTPDVGFCTGTSYYLIAWAEIWTLTTDRDVWACRLSTAGTFGSPWYVDFATDWAEYPTVPSKSPSPMGYAYRKTVGLSTSGTGNGDIYGASVDVGSETDSGYISISSDALNEAEPHLSSWISAGSPYTYLTWTRERTAGGDYDIMGRRVIWGSGGPSGAAIFAVDNTANNTTSPHCEAASTSPSVSRLIVTYTSNTNIYAKVYNIGSDPPALLESLTISAAGGSQNNGLVAMRTTDAKLGALVAFESIPVVTSDIYGQRLETVVTPPTITGPASPLADGTEGTSYGPVAFTATGDSPINWTVTAGTLPPGLTLAISGSYGGTPTQAGTYNFTVTASNSGGSDSRAYTHVIDPGPPVITGPASPLLVGYVGYPYGPTTFTSGGTPPITWSTTGTLPTGITLTSAGIYSGTPSAAGNYSFNVTATNAAGADTDAYVHVINTPTAPTNIQPTSPLADALINVAYSVQFSAEGSPASTITWSITAGAFPPGMSITAAGLYSGTPTATGVYNFTITATNGLGPTATAYAHTVTQVPAITSPAAGSITPNGLEGTAYTPFNFTATGYPAPTWGVTAGSLPPGMAIDINTGQYSGTPDTPGAYGFTVTATNSAGSSSRGYTHVIDAAPRIGLSASALTFDAPLNGPNPAPQTVVVSNIGGFSFNWTVSESGSPTANVYESPSSGGTLTAGQAQPMAVYVDVTGLSAGTYNVTLQIDAPLAINTGRQIAVTINVNNSPKLTLSETSLTIDAPEGGPDPAPRVVTVSNTGAGSLSWTATDGSAWLSVSPTTAVTLGGGASDELFVIVDTTGLTAASSPYSGTVTVTAPGATGSPATIDVTLNVHAVPVISLDPAALAFEAPLGGPNPAPQTATLTNVGAGTLNWTAAPAASWLAVSPSSGTLVAGASQTLTLTASVSGLTAGPYSTRISITGPGASEKQYSVTLGVYSAAPRIGVAPAALEFDVPSGSTTSVSQSVTVTNTGTGTLAWAAAEGETWLSVAPASSNLAAGASASPAVTVNPTGLAAGTYTALITVSDAAASNNPQIVAVRVNVGAGARVGVIPSALTFNTVLGAAPAPQPVTVSNTGGAALNWTAAPSEAWIAAGASAGPLAPGASEAMAVTLDVTGLAAGTYTGRIVVADASASTSPEVIAVTLNITTLVVPEEKDFGYCGSVGLELMLPLAVLWAARRIPARRGKKGRRG